MSDHSAASGEEVEAEADGVLFGDDAVVAAADQLYHKMRDDERFKSKFEGIELSTLASKLRKFLANAFEGDWPSIQVGPGLLDECYENFATLLKEVLDSDETSLLAGLDALEERLEDERLASFFEYIQGMAVEEEEGSEDLQGEEAAKAEGEDEETAKMAKDAEQAARDAMGTDVNVTVFDELRLEQEQVQAANDAWRLFISTAESREAAGEAIYAALFEGAPSLQSLFTTPRAVQAMRFMNGLASFVTSLDDPARLKILVETLGFGHLHLDVTVPRVIIFRDAIIDLFKIELAERFNTQARNGWMKLLNYVGGAIIYVKANYAERINTLLKSWKLVNKSKDDRMDAADGMEDSSEAATAVVKADAGDKQGKKGWGIFKSGKKNAGTAGTHTTSETAGETGGSTQKNQTLIGSQGVPTTYPEMFLFNAAVMGFGTSSWMSEVLAVFHNIVTNVSNSARLQEECDVLALRIARIVKGQLNLYEYKSCMLASLRSLLPKTWDSGHEVAWTWMWENVERLILRVHGQPPSWEKALGKILGSFDEETKFEIRKDIYARFFTLAPAGQDFFKQSNTYLHFIADKIIGMTLELYQNPVKMVDDISALGLRHVGYGIPTELFGPFVTACVEVMMTRTNDETTVEAFRWSLGLVSKMLVRTITEGSTIVMKAINNNSQRNLKKAVSCAPRGDRAKWMLLVQVGTQSISPLAWSVESGNFEAAIAIIKDLLSFRADRDRYYYGVDDLFARHPDIIKMLCDQAPDLLPKMLDGLIWRSRLTESGMRRVNYYLKYLLIQEDGSFSPALKWITATRDPKLVCHPVIVLTSDIVWSRVAYRAFLSGKSWLFFTLLVFITSQSVLKNLNPDDARKEGERIAIFACRAFIYAFSMTQLIYCHIRDSIKAYKSKNTVKVVGISIPKYLKQWQDATSFFLALSLMVMCALEPILWCWTHQDGTLFKESCSHHVDDLSFSYTLFSMISMFLYYILLLDLTVVSTHISAFVLVCVRMASEVGLFLGAIAVCILMFSSAISVLKQESDQFAGIPVGSFTLARMVLETYSTEEYAGFRDEPAVLVMTIVFLLFTVIFLLSLLIAQLSCAYSGIYEDMVGYARLERGQIIVELMPSIAKARWTTFVSSLRLTKRVEFNEGDIGVAGGIQIKEPASANPTTVDMIKRFGGSTSPDIQWPEDQDEGDGGDRYEKLEKLIQKTLQRVTKSGGSHSRSKGAGGGSSSGMGSKLEGSGSDESDGGGDDQEDEE
jgi:hemoglobin-like flavoprotein